MPSIEGGFKGSPCSYPPEERKFLHWKEDLKVTPVTGLLKRENSSLRKDLKVLPVPGLLK
jgi:hypothetical protein